MRHKYSFDCKSSNFTSIAFLIFEKSNLERIPKLESILTI